MNKKKNYNNDKIISIIRERIEQQSVTEEFAEQRITDQQVAVLLGELQIAQLELEMQNDELSVSAQMLEAERSRFAGFFNLAPVGYFILNQIGLVAEANQAGADLLCISKSEMLNKRFQSFVITNDWDNFHAFLHRLQTTDGKQNQEIKLLLNNGREIYTHMEGIAISNVYIDKIQYYITVIDITESRLAQERLLETTQRLEMTLKASSTGTWTMELGTNKVFFDDFSYSMLEIDPGTFEGSIRGFLDLIHPDDQLSVKQSLLTTVNSFSEVDLEFRINTKNGRTKVISAIGHEVKNQTMHHYFAGILMDITERKRVEKEAQELQSEKQKLVLSATFNAQEKERYRISSALHDSVCQILYGIRLNLQNIQLTRNLKGEFKNVNQLLDQAIRETRELSYELTPSILRDFGFKAGVREMTQRLSTSNFRIKTTIKSGADLLHPEIQLYVFRMIQELINNCIKHAHATVAEVAVCTEEGWVTVTIGDNGRGFITDVDHALAKGSGIRGIKNRVFLLNGSMDLQTGETGTKVTIKFRIDPELLGLYLF